MEYKLMNTAIVVLSEGNNPKLLNHDFLSHNGIVPEDWEMQDLLVTSPFSRLTYKNGVELIVEINKLQIKVTNPEALPWHAELPKIATRYLQVLPHVHYAGVGINFTFVARSYPQDPFASLLQDGDWLRAHDGLSSAAIELHFKNKKPWLNVKIEQHSDPGRGSDAKADLVLVANYHHEFAPHEEQERAAFISQAGELKERFLTFSQNLPFENKV